MLASQRLRFESKVLFEHASEYGPLVTNVKGSLVVGAIRLLKAAGHYERYMTMLPSEHHDIANYTLATSWAPASHTVIHCQTVDAMLLGEKELQSMGELLGAHMLDSLFATLLSPARKAGAEAGSWMMLKTADRVWNRIYQGGGCSLIQTGPKDAIFEVHGVPFAESTVFRVMHCAFLRGTTMLLAKACIVKPLRAREPKSGTLAVSISWV